MGSGNLERLFWNRYAGSYDGLGKHYQPYVNLVQDVCARVDTYAQGRSLSVLDAGCGTGIYATELAGRGHKVVGLDSSQAMVEQAERKAGAKAWPHPPKIINHDLEAPLPFESRLFDAVISVHVLYTLRDHRRFVDELHRVAKTSALVVVANSCDHLDLKEAIDKQIRMSKGVKRVRAICSLLPVIFWNLVFSFRQTANYRLTSCEELRSLLEEAGVSNIEIVETYVGSLLAVGQWR
jgi:SAM-dependent methyltransferase